MLDERAIKKQRNLNNATQKNDMTQSTTSTARLETFERGRCVRAHSTSVFLSHSFDTRWPPKLQQRSESLSPLFTSSSNRPCRAKTTKTDQLEVVCRITPYHGENACVDLVGDDQLRLVPPPDQLLNRRNEPRVRFFLVACCLKMSKIAERRHLQV